MNSLHRAPTPAARLRSGGVRPHAFGVLSVGAVVRGLGSYPSLVVAAENAAEALNTHPGYVSIRAAFASSAPTDATESAIWASPWASSHYANGSHWHYTPVPVVTAPPGAW